MSTRETGRQAEILAQKYLESCGLSFVCSNYSYRTGEIDIVMKQNEYWVAIEVKYRSDEAYGMAVEFVSPAKIRKIQRTFEHYLIQNGLNPAHTPMRIDVVALDGQQLHWLKNIA